MSEFASEMDLYTNNATDMVTGFASGSSIFSTIQGDDFETKLNTVNAVANATPLSDNLDKAINLKNFVLQAIKVRDTDNKIVSEDAPEIDAVRVILIDENDVCYAAISTGIVAALQTITGILGMPSSWPRAVTVIATEERSRSGFRFMTLKLASKAAQKK